MPPLEGFTELPESPYGASFYNATRDAEHDPTIPDMIDRTNDLVETYLDANRTFANDSWAQAQDIVAELRDAKLPEKLPDPPAAPSIITGFNSTLGLGFEALPNLGDISPDGTFGSGFVPDEITIPDVESLFPPSYVRLFETLALPTTPTYVAPLEPAAPTLDPLDPYPTEPTADYGLPPALLEINLPAYVAPVLPVFGDLAPEFDVLPPEPIINWTEPVYTSEVKDAVKAVLLEMLAGGTGITEDVERAIWERGRSRLDIAANGKISALIEEWASRGFTVPQGYQNGAIYAALDESESKATELSRDVAIEQANLEQKNRQFAVQYGISYEQVMSAIFLAVVDRNFQIAKFSVETQIQIYNMRVTAFNVAQAVFSQKIELYKAQLEGVFAYIKAFEAMAIVEKAKAEINVAKVQSFEALVKAYSSRVDAYKSSIQALGEKANIQKLQLDAYKTQIDAMIGLINGQRAKFEVYGEQVRGEIAKTQLEDANVRIHTSLVQSAGLISDVRLKRADVQMQSNNQKLQWIIGNMTRINNLHASELQLIQANLAAYQQGTTAAVAKYDAERSKEQALLQAQLEISRISIAKYQALLEQWKTRSVEIIQMANINAESLRAAGQITSNLASGALAGMHVSAGMSGGVSASESHGVSTSNSSGQSRSTGESNSYSVAHNYQHRV